MKRVGRRSDDLGAEVAETSSDLVSEGRLSRTRLPIDPQNHSAWLRALPRGHSFNDDLEHRISMVTSERIWMTIESGGHARSCLTGYSLIVQVVTAQAVTVQVVTTRLRFSSHNATNVIAAGIP